MTVRARPIPLVYNIDLTIHVFRRTQVMIASTTQGFYAWRITRLTGHAWIGWAIAAATFIQFRKSLSPSNRPKSNNRGCFL
jgi:hypothetical protein